MNATAATRRIDEVDTLARTLYQRTKQAPSPAFDDAAVAVRQMYMSLRHMRAEAADPKSVLNKPDSSLSSLYTTELEPIIDHCEFALKQLGIVIDRFDKAENKDALTDRIAAFTTKIAEKEMDLAFFLDTIQAPPSSTSDMSDQMALLDYIKQEIECLASKVFSRRSGALDDDSETLWREFKTELEQQEFTSDELETHKAAAKAYIQQLSSAWNRNCGSTPTYQSVAEFEANTAPQVQYPLQPPVVPPKVPIPPPKENGHSPKNEKSMLSIKTDRHALHDNPSATVLPTQYSFNVPYANMEDGKDHGDMSGALVSTKELVEMDNMNRGMNGMQIHADQHTQLGRLGDDLPLSPTSQTVAGSPRYHSSTLSDGRNQVCASTSPNNLSWLAPDGYGKGIPPDAPWTKIRRTLVSPEVLDRAGVRYEARPEYVAVLGRLSREQIAEYARQSAECRAARAVPPLPARRSDDDGWPKPAPKKHHSDDDILYDSSDSTEYEDDRSHGKDTRGYPYIVDAPSKNSKTSPSTTAKPKPILKNKNENHVRFDPEPHEVEHPSSAPSSYNHDRRRDYYHGEGSSSSRRRRDHSERDYYYDRGDRPHRSHRDRRERKKKSWGETLGAVSLGGAALLLGGGF